MNQNEPEFGEDLTHRQLLALPRHSEAGSHLDRAPDRSGPGPARPPCSIPTELLKSTPRSKRE